jgi:histidinol-phosphate aminotransferase
VTPRLRPVLQTLPAYVPGRSVPGTVKLASNENAYPPLPVVLDRIAEAANAVNRYPDNDARELTSALAHRLGLAVDRVAVGCGSVSLCTQLVQAVADAGDEVLYAWRSFEAYPIIAAVSGAASVQVPLREHVHDLGEMAARITERTRLVFLCNPNNPTGTAVRRDEVLRFLHAVPHDVVVAVDEAYREFVTDPDVPDGLTLFAEHPNVVVLRTFSNAYGLAGLRVGYAVAGDPTLIAALHQTQVPFAVSSIAQQAALASLAPEAEAQLMARVEQIVTERVGVTAQLLELGYSVPPSQANFVWLPLGDQALPWAAACEQHGVVVRAFDGHGVRVTIGAPQENERFLAAAAALAGAAVR